MKALRLEAYNDLRLVDVPIPEPGRDEVRVKVGAVGICGSDVHGMDGSSGRRIPPIIMGHEAAGTIDAVGDGTAPFAVGDRVTFDSTVSCGKCRYCAEGAINLCENRQVLGVSCDEYRRHGAFAEYVVVPQRILYRVPENLPLNEAAMVEPVSIAVHAVSITPIRLADSALVVGAGMIGLLTVQALRAAGVGFLAVSDVVEDKLAMAKNLGADRAVNVKDEDLREAVLAETGGRGADVVIDAVGSPASFAGAVSAVRPGGTVTLIGNIASEVPMPLQHVVTRQIRLQGSCASAGEYPACLALMARGDIDVKPLLSATAPLEKGASWFDRLSKAEPGLVKVVLAP